MEQFLTEKTKINETDLLLLFELAAIPKQKGCTVSNKSGVVYRCMKYGQYSRGLMLAAVQITHCVLFRDPL